MKKKYRFGIITRPSTYLGCNNITTFFFLLTPSLSDFATQKFIEENFNFTSVTWSGGRAKLAGGYWKWVDGSRWLYENWGYVYGNHKGEVATVLYSTYKWHYYSPATYKFWSLCLYQVPTETHIEDTYTRSNSIRLVNQIVDNTVEIKYVNTVCRSSFRNLYDISIPAL